MGLLTQSAAIKEIRERSGLSEATATAKVKAMPKTRDGCRDKVSRYSVELVIAEIERPPVTQKSNGIRPLSPKKIANIRSFGVMPRQRA